MGPRPSQQVTISVDCPGHTSEDTYELHWKDSLNPAAAVPPLSLAAALSLALPFGCQHLVGDVHIVTVILVVVVLVVVIVIHKACKAFAVSHVSCASRPITFIVQQFVIGC